MTGQIKPNRKPHGRRKLWIGLALAMFVSIGALLVLMEDTADVTKTDTSSVLQTVSVQALPVKEVTAVVDAFAEVRPRWSAEIRTPVGGRIVEVREAALAGAKVPTGAVLFQIEKVQYETAVAAAELMLAEARLGLRQANNQTTVARRQFERDGVRAPNDLALHLPQLEIAKRQVASAEAQLHAAKQQLADTIIVAPFSGFVTERFGSLGQTVAAGEPLVNLMDDTRFELTAEVSRENWTLLDHPIHGQIARLVDMAGNPVGTATVRRGGGFLDQNTRQYRVFLEVPDTAERSILSGDVLRVQFTGRTLKNTFSLPETALTRTGHVWFVDQEDKLRRLEPKILFRRDDQIVIAAPTKGQSQRLAITPLASFLPGQRVAPKSVEE